MRMMTRGRYILFATLSYTLLALAWILLSDQLLLALVSPERMVWVSSVKGSFFVAASAAFVYMSLRAVPTLATAPGWTLLDTLALGVDGAPLRRWSRYLFAATITLSMLWLQQSLQFDVQRPRLILYMLPVILSALMGGLGPGLLATGLAGLGADLLAPLRLHGDSASPQDRLQWAFLLLNGVLVSLLSAVLQRSLAKLSLNARLLDAVLAGSSDAVFVKDLQGRYLLANAATASFVGKRVDELLGADDLTLFEAGAATRLRQSDAEIMRAGTVRTLDEQVLMQDGRPMVFAVTKGPVRDQQGAVIGLFGIARDITEERRREAELDRAAHYDALTGAPNRRLLADRLRQAIQRCARSGKSSAVCFLDLDGFKAVNDRYGHAVGDQLLIGVAAQLRAVMRADDTLARPGGDEFVLLLCDIASPEECTLILDRVLQAVARPVQIGPHRIHTSASIGVSLYPADKVDADTLLRHADQAMLQAKASGKNRYLLFDPASDRRVQLHRETLERLRQALQHGEFALYYQPKVDLEDGEVIGVEALLRWLPPGAPMVAPAEFLPHLHGSDLEGAFGAWVLRAAVAQAAAWQEAGEAVKVSANISANHLLQPNFFDDLRSALAEHPQLPPSQLELEVLETAEIGDMEQAVAILQRCRELGVNFALDDFGTGYSSLTYLRKLPVDTLKIDQSFVRDMLSDPDDLGIVEGVIRLAGVFQRKVIAEGVETLEHGALLRRLGCRLAQGYGIARPMPAAEFPAWRRQWQDRAIWRQLPAP